MNQGTHLRVFTIRILKNFRDSLFPPEVFVHRLNQSESIFFFFLKCKLTYNVGLVSGVQQGDSVIHISTLFQIIFHYRLL